MQIKNQAKRKIDSFKNNLSKEFLTSSIDEKPYNFEFKVSDSSDKLKVQVYFGKKGIKIVLQGNKDTNLYNEVNAIVNDQPILNLSSTEFKEPASYIGSDESGKGDYFGPLATAAVFVDEKSRTELLNLGVRDSKVFNDNQIDRLAIDIKKILKNNYELVVLNPLKYNELYKKFNNLNKMLKWCHTTAIEKLASRVDCSEAIIDKFSKEVIIISSGSSLLKVHQFTKAEKYIAVAAASILARNKFNMWFKDRINEGNQLPKGAVSGIVENGKRIVREEGRDRLVEYAKLHFKTTKQI